MSRAIEIIQSWPSLVVCVAAFGFMGYGVQTWGSAKEDELRKAMKIESDNDPRVVAQHENNKALLASIFSSAGYDEEEQKQA
eukprot:CAMPEP_0114612930 /NCGR_PEP_ID=MMETSP0168-20121206/4871_1 /TAXON_ID=95228 ORGANISM="Vannella sp., Strain DIVA3 517/6/12" /NCGR_SAMPLE_ID=MMETSP0168 /ASSEMBLY_ACC=CAM_ASM_000044 /LENGTH=81 /DNA_ID=CAMNT_0001823921 /DNA_START=19 /DNA_END=264 /DNA_ORIENTATION=-